jgi:hypothetical protein
MTVRYNWKGKTFNQITSKIKRNKNDFDDINTTSRYFRSQPLSIYRREIVTTTNNNNSCGSRTSLSIDLFNMPNGTITNSSINSLNSTLDINLTTNKYERGECNSTVNCFNPASNALKKLRSGGMIRRQFDISKNNDTYAVSTNQYLVSRNRTFQQNQYNYIRQGSAISKPGDALSSQNIYTSNGLNHCKKFQLDTETSFRYQWIDTLYYDVIIPVGDYTVDDINTRFQSVMTQNFHFFVNRFTRSREFLMNITYNSFYNTIELHIKNTNVNIFSPMNYEMPLDPNNREIRTEITTWKNPGIDAVNSESGPLLEASLWPVIIIDDNAFKNVIGFNAGYYPNYELLTISNKIIEQIRDDNPNITLVDFEILSYPLSFNSIRSHLLQPRYVPIYYKPNNPNFAQQGGVSCSTSTLKTKYDAITNNSDLYRRAYGFSVANALAYGVPQNGYTVKEKIGFPMTSTPKFSAVDGSLMVCNQTRLHNG